MLSNVGRSFSTRLSIWVTGLVTVVFGVALVMMFRFSQSVVASESVEKDMQTLESVALQVDHVLHQTEITARITGSLVRKSLAIPDSIPVICSQAARTAPRLESDVPDTLMISSDREKVADILTELLANANKFTQQGTITLACRQMDERSVAFSVADTGIGISADDRQMIFSQFEKVDRFTDGIGLGLPLSLRMAHLLGGDLKLDPDYHGGACFILRLPLNLSAVSASDINITQNQS